MWDHELETAKLLAVRAGTRIIEIYEADTMEVSYKEDTSPLTVADKASNQIILDGLKAAYPDYAILSEEEKDNKKDWKMIIVLLSTRLMVLRNL